MSDKPLTAKQRAQVLRDVAECLPPSWEVTVAMKAKADELDPPAPNWSEVFDGTGMYGGNVPMNAREKGFKYYVFARIPTFDVRRTSDERKVCTVSQLNGNPPAPKIQWEDVLNGGGTGIDGATIDIIATSNGFQYWSRDKAVEDNHVYSTDSEDPVCTVKDLEGRPE